MHSLFDWLCNMWQHSQRKHFLPVNTKCSLICCRSPGGTPIKKEPATPCQVNDHASIFARALKRKFSLCPAGSPESDKENENTPVSPFTLVVTYVPLYWPHFCTLFLHVTSWRQWRHIVTSGDVTSGVQKNVQKMWHIGVRRSLLTLYDYCPKFVKMSVLERLCNDLPKLS